MEALKKVGGPPARPDERRGEKYGKVPQMVAAHDDGHAEAVRRGHDGQGGAHYGHVDRIHVVHRPVGRVFPAPYSDCKANVRNEKWMKR